MLVGTTNNYGAIDEAMMRRGRLTLFQVDFPTQEVREQIFNFQLQKIGDSEQKSRDELAKYLATKTSHCSGADMMGVISDARKKALLAGRKEIEQDFIDAL